MSPVLNDITAEKIKQVLVWRLGINLKNNENLYSVTAGCLKGTYSNQISVRLNPDNQVIIEGSAHKAEKGHNVFGGPKFLMVACKRLIDAVNKAIGIKLPLASDWEVLRVDVAHIFKLGSLDAVLEYLEWLRMATYPRRRPTVYQGCVYWPGRRFTLKFYSKGLEFRVHDKKNLIKQKVFSSAMINQIESIADEILRVEVEIKTRELKEIHGKIPKVKDIDDKVMNNYWQVKVNKLLGEREDDKKMLLVVSESDKVKKRFESLYGGQMARNLYGTWSNLAKHGEEVVKTELSRATFFRHRKLIIEAGVSWINTDVMESDRPRLVPADFVPSLNDKRLAG